VDIRLIVTDLCVMDFGGADHRPRLVSLHPGIGVEQVIENTCFEVEIAADVPVTTAPTTAQLAVIAALDPHNQRAHQIRDNPPGDRSGTGS
jgi:glutaconate CoA-transferase subunit B